MGKKIVQGKGLIYRGFLKQGDAQNLQHGVEIQGQVEPFANDGHEQVAADGDPDLSFDGVLRSAVKGLDAQVLFDPFEEQFNMPATTVQFCDDVSRKSEVIGEKHQSLFPLGIPIPNAPKLSWIAFSGVEPLQRDGLIALYAGVLVHRMRNETTETEVLPRACNEESTVQGPAIQPFEVEVAAVHDVEGAGFGSELVEDVHVVNACRCNADKRGNLPAQIEQGMQFQGMLGRTKVSPRKQRHAQVDGGRVQRIDGIGQIQTQVFVAIQPPGFLDQSLREVAIDPPIARLVGIGQRTAGNLAANAQMIKPVLLRAQAGHDIAQTFAIAQLREHHGKKLIPARKASYPIVAGITLDTPTKLVSGQMIDQLRKQALSTVHVATLLATGERITYTQIKSILPFTDFKPLPYKGLQASPNSLTGH